MAVPYRVLAADLLDNTVRDELPVHDLRWSHVLNAPGAMSGWVSLDDAKCTRANLDPGGTAIYVERGGRLVWGGILWRAQPQSTTRKLDIAATGFWSYFRRRLIRSTLTYAATDQLAIARGLIDYAQDQPGGDLGIVTGSETDGTLRDRTYPAADRKNLGEAVEQLAAVENGFDFSIEVAWDTDQLTPLRTFVLYSHRRGSRIDGLVFNHNVTGVADLGESCDAYVASNLVDCLGAGDGAAMLIATQADTSLLSRYPLLETALAYRDITEPATLQSHAAAELGRRRLPVELPTLTMGADTFPGLGSYQIGDEGLVTLQDGWIDLRAYHRIQSYEVNVPDSGRETITPTFVAADAQTY